MNMSHIGIVMALLCSHAMAEEGVTRVIVGPAAEITVDNNGNRVSTSASSVTIEHEGNSQIEVHSEHKGDIHVSTTVVGDGNRSQKIRAEVEVIGGEEK
jgi:hypothetical protein